MTDPAACLGSADAFIVRILQRVHAGLATG